MDMTCECVSQAALGSALGAVTACVLGFAVGLALLEIPYSLPLAVVLAIVMVTMGLLIIFSPAVRGTGAVRNAPWLERFVVSVIAILAIAGGGFAIALYLKLRDIPPQARLFM